MLQDLVDGFHLLLSVQNLLAMLGGTLCGILIGALPGLSTSIGLAVLIPLTFGMDPLIALGLMAGIFNGSGYGCAIPAILLNIPGKAEAIATTFDGYPMTLAGKSGLALKVACYSSALGGAASGIALLLLAPPLAAVTLAFGPAEYFWVAALGLASISVLLGGDSLKGLISASVGLVIATVGMDRMTGKMRFTFGTFELADGINIIVVLTGLFALSRVFEMAEKAKMTGVGKAQLALSGQKLGRQLTLSLVPTILRSSTIGILIGILPGAGGNVAAFLSYNEEKRAAKNDGDTFGKGNPRGVAAAECGNSADNGSSFIPTLTLGVPGNAIAALIMGALLVHGLQPGPSLFRNHGDVVYGFMFQMLLTSLMLFFLGGMVATRIFAQVLRLPEIILAPMIVALMVVGIYTTSYSLFDLYLALAFGLVGYFMHSLKFPMAPLVLGVVLGGMAEQNLRTALQISRGDWTYLFGNPLSQLLIAVLVLALATPLVRAIRERGRRTEAAPPSTA